MSDLRLEDLRAMDSVDGVIVGRRVSRREVLEALGAEKRWWCHDPEDDRCTQFSATRWHDDSGCGYVWVVDDAT